MIAIIDYGMGNLRSVQKAFERVGADARIETSADQIARAEKVVLPGVGAFRDAIGQLRSQHLVDPIREAIGSGRPFLGICLGLQLLFDISYEDGEYTGLSVVPGKVVRFDFQNRPETAGLKIPHMGWNQLQWTSPCPLLEGVQQGQHFYFVHSYYVEPSNGGEPSSSEQSKPGSANPVASGRDPLIPRSEGSRSLSLALPASRLQRATCNYGYDFTAMIWRDNLFATQFHPEKSQSAGLTILRNFAKL